VGGRATEGDDAELEEEPGERAKLAVGSIRSPANDADRGYSRWMIPPITSR
jgi:hypothetical protein